MQKFVDNLITLGTDAGLEILLAIVVFIVGKIVIGKVMKIFDKSRVMGKQDPSVKSFLRSALKVILYVVLIISVIGILGVPMASVVTVIASCGVAVGLALQGALSNIAGGIMILIFRPFNIGDYIAAAGEEGVVKEMTLFYTIITTVDNKRITIPNGAMMNANVTNFSAEPDRRVDLKFDLGKDVDIDKVNKILLDAMQGCDKVIKSKDMFAGVTGGTDTAMTFEARMWVKSADYWNVYLPLTQQICKTFGEQGITAPATRVITG